MSNRSHDEEGSRDIDGPAPEPETRERGWKVPPRYGNVRLNESGVLPYRAVRLESPPAEVRDPAQMRVLARRALDDTASLLEGMRREQGAIERLRNETHTILARLNAA